MNEILCFLNELDLTDRIKNDHIENLRWVRKRLVFEFKYCNVFKLIHALNIIDKMNVLLMTNILGSRLGKTNSIRECVLCLNSFKYFVEKELCCA